MISNNIIEIYKEITYLTTTNNNARLAIIYKNLNLRIVY